MVNVRDPVASGDYTPARSYVGCPHCAHPVDVTADVAREAAHALAQVTVALHEGTDIAALREAVERSAAFYAEAAGDTDRHRFGTSPISRLIAHTRATRRDRTTLPAARGRRRPHVGGARA